MNEVAEPNPIWGLHLAPGALAGALVRRTDSGVEVLETFTAPAPTDAAGLRDAAVEALRRRGVRGRAAMVAAADHGCTVRTGQIPAEELYLNDEEIFHQLHDFAPFEPGEGHLTYVSAGKADARRFLLAGIPFDAHAEIEELAQALDGRFHGIGLATSSLYAGARALGLVGERGYVVVVQARQTKLLAFDAEKMRRYLLAAGLEQCERDSATTALLAEDILRTTAYHVEQARRQEPDEELPDIVFAGPLAQRARAVVGPALGARLAPLAARNGRNAGVTGAEGAPLSDLDTHSCVGAVGAALEAFRTPEERLVLRHPPTDVPEYEESGSGRGLPAAAAVLVVAGLAYGAWEFTNDPGATPSTERIERGTGPVIDPSGNEDDRDPSAIAHAALRDVARREAALRCAVAATSAARSAAPAYRSRGFQLDEAGSTIRFVLLLDVKGAISPAARRDARAAVEGIDGMTNVSVDVQDGALRVRGRTEVVDPPAAAEGDREVDPSVLLAADRPFDVRGFSGISDPARTARLLFTSGGATPVALLADETEFAEARRAAIEALVELLPDAGPVPVIGDGTGELDRVTFPLTAPLASAAVLERRPLPDGEWAAAGELRAGATEFTDHVPGASGRYSWRLVTEDGQSSAPVEREVEIPVTVECTGFDMKTGHATFRLVRPFAGADRAETVTVRVGRPIEVVAASDGLVFEPGLRLTGLTGRKVTEAVTMRVPRFLPDGRVERDADGNAAFEERPGEREIDVCDVTARDAAGEATTWVRKMTDG